VSTRLFHLPLPRCFQRRLAHLADIADDDDDDDDGDDGEHLPRASAKMPNYVAWHVA
jgi:hypothetical protein